MNQVAQRKIPEEWTPQMWQAHVTEQEKRINELEREVYNLKQRNDVTLNTIQGTYHSRIDGTAPQQGVAWLR